MHDVFKQVHFAKSSWLARLDVTMLDAAMLGSLRGTHTLFWGHGLNVKNEIKKASGVYLLLLIRTLPVFRARQIFIQEIVFFLDMGTNFLFI